MKNNRKQKIYLILIGVFSLFIIILSSYAYFIAQGGTASTSSVRVQTSTTDNLSFSVGSSVNLTADQASFASGKGNVSGNTTATALLTANNATNKATKHYYVYFNIASNPFIYTTSNSEAELLLTVTDPNGKVVTSLDGLNYVTSGGVSGFDITTYTGPIKLADYYEISASPSKTDTWKVQVTLVNLDSDQTSNAGKSFSGTVLISKSPEFTLAEHLVNLYQNKLIDNLYYHDASLANGAEDNSYRYAGGSDDVKNFVCFASNESPCPNDNLYRIVGEFSGLVKVVKSTYASSTLLGTDGDYAENNKYHWNYNADTTLNTGNGSNIWSTSLLNKTNLNTNFLNNIGSSWAEKIAVVTYKNTINSGSFQRDLPKSAYTEEVKAPSLSYDVSAKVGMLYISDYGYSASPKYWGSYYLAGTTNAYSQITAENWLYDSGSFWSISSFDNGYNAYYINGIISNYKASSSYYVKPCFYLKESTVYIKGTGEKSNPFIIN